MWVIIPVKKLKNAKLRLEGYLSQEQRAELSVIMLQDVLEVLSTSEVVTGITIISSEGSLAEVAKLYGADFLLTESDSGYSEDAAKAIDKVCQTHQDDIAIIPSDVPLLGHDDLIKLDEIHEQGVILCPAQADGGTNGLLFDSSLQMPLLFGVDSLERYRQKAAELDIPLRIERIAGLERDIDRVDDLIWVLERPENIKTINYLKSLHISTPTENISLE